jgi:cell division protein FtsB
MNLQTISTGIAILVGIAFIIVFVKGGFNTATISSQQHQIDAYKGEIDALERRVNSHEKTMAEQGQQIAVLQKENELLRAQRPSAEAIAAVLELLKMHDQRLMEHDTKTLLALRGEA